MSTYMDALRRSNTVPERFSLRDVMRRTGDEVLLRSLYNGMPLPVGVLLREIVDSPMDQSLIYTVVTGPRFSVVQLKAGLQEVTHGSPNFWPLPDSVLAKMKLLSAAAGNSGE
jgi:hypothetical protein